MIKDLLNSGYSWVSSYWDSLLQQYLAEQATSGLPHALLITGTAGVGKEALALNIAASVLCQQRQEDGRACTVCKACRVLNGGGHPDLVVLEHLEDSEQIKVDQVRKLIHSLHLSAAMSGYRVAFIKNAERMNTNAANALLKTLEEPGEKTLLLLTTSHPGRLTATIRSRCQQLHIPLPDNDASSTYLAVQGEYSSEDITLALELAGGGPLLAAEMLAGEQLETARIIHSQLNDLSIGEKTVFSVVSSWQEYDPKSCWQWVLFWLHQGSTGRTVWPIFVSIDRQQQQKLYQTALAGWKRSSSGLRQDLQFQEWLLQWQSITTQSGSI